MTNHLGADKMADNDLYFTRMNLENSMGYLVSLGVDPDVAIKLLIEDNPDYYVLLSAIAGKWKDEQLDVPAPKKMSDDELLEMEKEEDKKVLFHSAI